MDGGRAGGPSSARGTVRVPYRLSSRYSAPRRASRCQRERRDLGVPSDGRASWSVPRTVCTECWRGDVRVFGSPAWRNALVARCANVRRGTVGVPYSSPPRVRPGALLGGGIVLNPTSCSACEPGLRARAVPGMARPPSAPGVACSVRTAQLPSARQGRGGGPRRRAFLGRRLGRAARARRFIDVHLLLRGIGVSKFR